MKKYLFTIIAFCVLTILVCGCTEMENETVKINIITKDKIAKGQNQIIDKWVLEIANYYKIEDEKILLVPEVYINRPNIVPDSAQKIIINKDWAGEIKHYFGTYTWKEIVNDYDNFLLTTKATSEYFWKNVQNNDSIFVAFESNTINKKSKNKCVFYYSDGSSCIDDKRQITDLNIIRDSIKGMFIRGEIDGSSDIFIFYNWCNKDTIPLIKDTIVKNTTEEHKESVNNEIPQAKQPNGDFDFNSLNCSVEFVDSTGEFIFKGVPDGVECEYKILVYTGNDRFTVKKITGTKNNRFPITDEDWAFVTAVSDLRKSTIYLSIYVENLKGERIAIQEFIGPYSTMCVTEGPKRCRFNKQN